VLAAALRLVGIRCGPDPHWFDYPTLTMYLLAPFQAWHSEPSYLTARLTIVGLALAGIAASWWLGRRAYGPVAGFVAAAAVAVETTYVAYSRMAVTDVPLTLGVAVALALLVSGRIELAGVVVGLAASAKYPGALLVAPLLVGLPLLSAAVLLLAGPEPASATALVSRRLPAATPR
jgi:4-amino-4-deoxy-L-arabinose transferase-like glycosyltransferase